VDRRCPAWSGWSAVEFVQVALEVLFAAMLIDADHTALEDAENPSTVLVVTSPRAYSLAL
jgi:hypothetical protein